MLQVAMIIGGGASREGGVGFGGKAYLFEVGEVDRLTVEVDLIHEGEGNLASCEWVRQRLQVRVSLGMNK